jgi:hypothetical protein
MVAGVTVRYPAGDKRVRSHKEEAFDVGTNGRRQLERLLGQEQIWAIRCQPPFDFVSAQMRCRDAG